MEREDFVQAIISKTGRPYIYGSNGGESFDCSGLIVWAMRTVWPEYTDKSCQGLFDFYKENVITPDKIKPGCLLFYSSFSHVMTCIHDLGGGILVLQGANGGTSICKTIQDAYANKAMVYPVYAKIVNGIYNGFWSTGYETAVDPFNGAII